MSSDHGVQDLGVQRQDRGAPRQDHDAPRLSSPRDLVAAVADVLDDIAPGSVATYGDVAAQLGISPRQAGREVSRAPDEVPWWRVVRADGIPGACRGGHAPELLEAEGVPMSSGRVDLNLARQSWSDAPD
ncbi:MGMT family protein [Brevibacterium sp.]|uniref:MGMT family protein n=1 Tax=Brevibacterium sp. TaxID=1701 RepID=UPI00281215D5|nr:MGMT family protein [Brevibacterium sp.]